MQTKTLNILFLQGSATGIKVVGSGDWIGNAYIIPRKQLSEIIERKELKSPSIYFLIGYNELDDMNLYIGEAENFVDRIKEHSTKDWNYAIPFIAHNDGLNKAHIKYLESVFYEKAKSAGRITLVNVKSPTQSKLSEYDVSKMESFIFYIELILKTLGYNFFESPKIIDISQNADLSENNKVETFVIKSKSKNSKKEFIARGSFNNEGFVLHKGSEVTVQFAQSESESVTKRRIKELKLGNLKKEVDSNGVEYHTVVNEILFGRPSAAAAFTLGYSVNGLDKWKTDNGESIKSIRNKI
jgi:hypothetical protein